MKTFNDNAGRTWTLSVNIAAVKRVRSLLDVDLLELSDGKLLERVTGDPVLLCDVIYCLLKPEAEKANVSDEDFGRAMAGDAIDCATEAFLEELVAFFRQGQRQVLKKALAKLQKYEAKAVAIAMKRLDDPELDARVEAELEKVGEISGAWPESSASTPDH